MGNSKCVIASDSMSCLVAITNPFNSHELVTKIQEKLLYLETNFHIILLWVPSHQGISGNEEADLEAKAAISKEPDQSLKISYQDSKKFLKNKLFYYWNILWSNERTKLHTVRHNVQTKAPLLTSRSDQCKITRVRVGHTNLTHSYLLTKDQQTMCEKCLTQMTVSHILINCPHFNDARRKHNLKTEMSQMLASPEECYKVVKYLKYLDLYDLI